MIKDGQVIEEGNHESLSSKEGGHYAHLVNLQFADDILRPLD